MMYKSKLLTAPSKSPANDSSDDATSDSSSSAGPTGRMKHQGVDKKQKNVMSHKPLSGGGRALTEAIVDLNARMLAERDARQLMKEEYEEKLKVAREESVKTKNQADDRAGHVMTSLCQNRVYSRFAIFTWFDWVQLFVMLTVVVTEWARWLFFLAITAAFHGVWAALAQVLNPFRTMAFYFGLFAVIWLWWMRVHFARRFPVLEVSWGGISRLGAALDVRSDSDLIGDVVTGAVCRSLVIKRYEVHSSMWTAFKLLCIGGRADLLQDANGYYRRMVIDVNLSLLANVYNYRVHSQSSIDAMRAVIDRNVAQIRSTMTDLGDMLRDAPSQSAANVQMVAYVLAEIDFAQRWSLGRPLVGLSVYTGMPVTGLMNH